QVGALAEAVGPGPGQGGQLLGGRGQAAGAEAGAVVEGAQAPATAAAVVVGAGVPQGAEQAQGAAPPLAVGRGGLVAVGAGDAAARVAVFFAPGGPRRPWRRPAAGPRGP